MRLAGVTPAHLGPVSLLGSWTWPSALEGQRHSSAPPAEMSLSPTPTPPKAFSGPVVLSKGPAHCLNPAPA